jgi:23S rRNA (uracil1939-C5)-methyltransferase
MTNRLSINKNEIHEIIIEDLGHNGEGVGKINGFTVFVEGGIPGDTLKVKMEKIKKNYAIASIIEISNPSQDRVRPLCYVANICGGCQIQHMDYPAQLRIKTERVRANIQRIGKLENVVIHDAIGMEKPWHYRNKAQFPVGIFHGDTVLGFYKKGTHDIVDIQSCYIQHESNDRIIETVKEYMKRFHISVYNEKTGKGLIRHVLTKIGFNTGEIMVVIVTNGKDMPYKNELVQMLKDAVPGLKSIVQNINTKKGNAILGNKCIKLHGSERIVDTIGNLKFQISPLSFFQVNPVQTKVLYEKALEYADLTGEESVFDIYCGIGTISLFLAQKAKKVYGIEIVEAAIEDAKENAKINDIRNVEFFAGEAEKLVPRLYEQGIAADVVVVDPPRKGCDEKVLDTIVKIAPPRIVYVSCNPATLARDLKYLDERGYRTIEIQPVDMFPHTGHVECVVLMSRVEK